MKSLLKVVTSSIDETEAPPAAPSADPLAALQAERDRVHAEYARLSTVDAPRVAAEAALVEIDQAEQAIDRAEDDELRRWAESGDGPAPEPMNAERGRLAERRASACNALKAAQARINVVTPRMTALNAEMIRIDAAMFGVKLESALAEARALDAEVHGMIEAIADKLMRIKGLRSALVATATPAPGKLHGERERLAAMAIHELDQFRPGEPIGENAKILQYMTNWQERL